jgi:hypothetical protein
LGRKLKINNPKTVGGTKIVRCNNAPYANAVLAETPNAVNVSTVMP